MTGDGFVLRDLINEVCNNSTIADPATLAKEVARRIGRNQQTEALGQALPIIVRHYLSLQRSGTQHAPASHTALDARGTPAVGGGRSRKVAAIRETWARMLRDRVSVGPDASDWKFLGDCTVEDLQYAEQIRRVHAARNITAADRFAHLSELLAEHGVATVKDLPRNTLDAALGEAA